jgi:hypothetical protein
MCGWCVDGLTFSPSYFYSISIKFLLLITKERDACLMSDGTADLYAKRNKAAKAA